MKEKSGRMMTALYVRKLKSRVLCFRTPKLLVRLRVHKDFKVIKFHLCTDDVNVSKKKHVIYFRHWPNCRCFQNPYVF